jgi:tetratricopeptide (TPR) repeat protein
MEAIQFADRAIAYFPEAATMFQLRKGEAALGAGDTKTARAAFNALSPNDRNTVSAFLLRFNTALYERDYDEARRAILTRLQLAHREALAPDILFEAIVASAEGDMGKARAAFVEARNGYETRLRDHPQDVGYISTTALVDASLGRKEEALREIEKAVELAKDPLGRPGILLDQAVVYYKLGDRDRALQQLEELAKAPHGLDYGDLLLNPDWDSLRGNPRFEKIVASLAPK